jgi:hypothetical protein
MPCFRSRAFVFVVVVLWSLHSDRVFAQVNEELPRDSVEVQGFDAPVIDSNVTTPSTDPAPTAEAEVAISNITSSFTFSFDLSIANDSKEGNEVLSADWLTSLSVRTFLDGPIDQFNGRIDATFGQHISYLTPQKTQDNLIVSFTPSRTILSSIDLRLLLEITAETQLTKGLVDTVVTDFLDPLFLYQSLFLGKRISANSENGSHTFDLTLGVGYALQQTFAEDFILEGNRNVVISETNPLNQLGVTIESGYSAIVDLNYSNDLTEGLNLMLGWKTVGMTKRDLVADPRDARVTSLFSLGLQFHAIQLTAKSHLVYDKNVSLRRELSNFSGFGIKLAI